ncbi:MAG TPA: preprotein translocase subunit SecA, partial [Acidimicrobiales bacterium]|nr:preprotein translocase subunit SecA [Acidimicrobiales bacterium]
MSVFQKVLRAGEGRRIKQLSELVAPISALEPEMQALTDAELAYKTVEFRERLANGETMDDLLIEAFAAVREAGVRTLGQRHFDVQLMGGMALHFGWIAEMKTGEGKTLVSTLPVYLNGLTQRGVHVVTVNDYLASRDAEWMGRLHRFMGLTVGRVGPDLPDPEQKRLAYACDVTYGTNTEFGFDYLRDNMARQREEMVQHGGRDKAERIHVFAIVDEVDSILIDEARTPLIISGPSDDSAKLYYQFASLVRGLVRDTDYEVDEEKRTVAPTEVGIAKIERSLGVTNLYDSVSTDYVHQLTQALLAKELYHRDKDYIVDGGEVKIIDEFTGRTLEGRRWSDGLHQAVEAKERVRIKDENHTWATVTLQNYFRLYEKLSGMTGTAETEAAEFSSTYNLQVVPIPTNLPGRRTDEADLIFKSEDSKFAAVVDDIVERRDKGQPVLVGTASVAKSEHLSRLLEKRGVDHEVLNAKQHFREAEIVAQAGRPGAVTVATNMAGRGVDIILGGNAEGLAARELRGEGLEQGTEAWDAAWEGVLARHAEVCSVDGQAVIEAGGLYVLGSERHESRRIDNQLRGRSGRQGDPGESRFFLSLEDELMRLFATGAVSWVMDKALPEDQPIEAKMVTKAIERAQNTVEARNAEQRKDVLKYDEVMNEQRKVIYARRLQILDDEDLEGRTHELLDEVAQTLVDRSCPEYKEEWDLDRVVLEAQQYWPITLSAEELRACPRAEDLTERLYQDAVAFYDKHSVELPGGEEMARALERDVMLNVLDLRWREHLAEMDHLREGIHLRSVANQDPLVAWQREGYEMFERMLDSIDDDYVKYITHIQVAPQAPAATDELSRATYQAPESPEAPLAFAATPDELEAQAEAAPAPAATTTVVKSPNQKLGRNE